MLECPICCNDYNNKQVKSFLKCAHNMCPKCLVKMKTCPFCRAEPKFSRLTCDYFLRYGIYMNNRKLFNLAVNRDKSIISTVDRFGETPLHCACRSGNFVKELIELGANKDFYNNQGQRPSDLVKKTSFTKLRDFLRSSRVAPTNLIRNVDNEILLAVTENDLPRFKKAILDCQIPSDSILFYIARNNLTDFADFLKTAGIIE